MQKLSELRAAIQAKQTGFRPMRAAVFMPVHGKSGGRYQMGMRYFDTAKQLSRYLDRHYKVINKKPNIIITDPDDITLV
jgi:hypothetical protein